MPDKKTIRFTVSLPQNLLHELDQKIVHNGYASRSELIRDLIRETMVDDAWNGEDAHVAGVLTIIYDHHQRELTQKLIDIQHDTAVDILCNTHVHLDHHNCLETIIMRGDAEAINRIALHIGGLKGVQFSKLTRTASF